ncbi:hypothetical protein H8N01_15690 [Streptomyces sp. AC536]|uniref:hypothetical protein n=1 Tax=Streptomyces buecherae TaxID=2763006 RepID=UPI00164D4F50|nr:hypothetical protein [Streptomyces buecherae]MBC3983967.1 hypothetical protein [Streptomyces buecherae]QNJ40017.1 hypothetical protein H7H31_09130 [Streptomyces buecherae]
MIVTMIVVAEVGFWVLLVGGLSVRYLLRRPRAGAAILMCEPVLELALLVATAIDLRDGATASTRHSLAAMYIGFSVAYGHYTMAWADRHFAYRFAGGPKPAKPPKYGMARAAHEWKMWLRTALGAGIAAGLLQLAIWFVDDPDRTAALRDMQAPMGMVVGIWLLVAVSYTLWPKKDPAGPVGGAPEGPAGNAPEGPAGGGHGVDAESGVEQRPAWQQAVERATHRDR